MKKKINKGSMTIELALLMPVILLVLFGVLFLFFYVHNRAWLTAAAYETALDGSMENARPDGKSRERDAWSDLANFIGEMVAKYADAMELDQLPDLDNYLRMKRMKQLYMELYKTENIEKSRSIIISIERNAAA